ncbi:MAG: hypothetical protein RMM06_05595 [Armatimonadota bacterium]|nr:hypothetical protein [bacterium]MCS7309416.1 hypothetical protein [Armatimonadota bacterium]MDW8105469.1 hypothetical protein [Armatimonadota bacterium]MDW8290175.1 hypothetical protein [Armatimonadota bacterium]
MRGITRVVWIVTLAAIVGVMTIPALAQEGYKLRRVFKVNDIRRYKMVMDINGEMKMGENSMPLNMQMVMTYREKVAGIKDGKATVHTTIESTKMYMNGQEFASPMVPDMSNMVITTIIDERNKVHEVKGLEKMTMGAPGLGGMNFGAGFNTPAMFPEDEVKVGDTWETEVPIPNAGDFKVTAKQTFIGLEKVGGVDAARIKTEVEIPYDKLMSAMAGQMPAGTPAMTGTMRLVSFTLYDLATGNILKVDGDAVMSLQIAGGNPQAPQGMQMNMTMKMSLTQVKDEKSTGK